MARYRCRFAEFEALELKSGSVVVMSLVASQPSIAAVLDPMAFLALFAPVDDGSAVAAAAEAPPELGEIAGGGGPPEMRPVKLAAPRGRPPKATKAAVRKSARRAGARPTASRRQATGTERHAVSERDRAKVLQLLAQGGSILGVSKQTGVSWYHVGRIQKASAGEPVAAASNGAHARGPELGEETGVRRRCEQCHAQTTRTVCPNNHPMLPPKAVRQ